MSTPELQLNTLYVLDDRGRIVRIREPGRRPPPAFAMVLGSRAKAWAVRDDVPDDVAASFERLAADEPFPRDFREPPRHADDYLALMPGEVFFGPAFVFPVALPDPGDVTQIEDAPAHRKPHCAVIQDGEIVSGCTCSRSWKPAAEAGLETIERHRRKGYAVRVTSAWAQAVRAEGRIPLYSTSWTNHASLAVASKLKLIPYASDWSITEKGG